MDICPECGSTKIQLSTFTAHIGTGGGVREVEGMECYHCDSCKMDPVDAEQEGRNQERLSRA